MTKKVLFICLGNIARSQMAEGFYNSLTHSTDAASAGCNPETHLHYSHPVSEVIEVMKEEGIDISKKEVKLVTAEMVAKADHIYVLNRKNDCPDFVVDSGKVTYWNVEDPFGKTPDGFRKIRDIIKEKVKGIIEA